MNDKIKELAEQAGFVLWGDETWNNCNQNIDWSSQYDEELENYTKLVLMEVIGTISRQFKGPIPLEVGQALYAVQTKFGL